MEVKKFTPKWAISKSRGRLMYASSDKLLVAYDYFMKLIPVTGSPATYYHNLKMSSRSVCTLPELGQVAQTHRFLPNFVAVGQILERPDSWGHSGLKTEKIEDNFQMFFLGAEFLVLVGFQAGYRFELWNWKAGKLLHSVSTPSFHSEVGGGGVQVHPFWWYQAALQSNTRVIILEIKTFKDHFYLEINYYFIEDGEEKLSFRRAFNNKLKKTSSPPKPCLPLQCFCWLPENRIIIATSCRVFKAGLRDLKLLKLGDLEANAASMVRNGSNLYVAYETGTIEVVSIDQDKWKVEQVINVGQSLAYACLSPDSKYLTVTTHGNIINLDVNGYSLKLISEVLEPNFGDIINVGFLGPILSYCVVAERSGALHIINESDGSVVSTMRIEEEISSMASSPLCSCVVLGSSIGFLYFVDCTNFAKPRIVLCEKAYDLPIQRLKFDNFGRFVMTSSENQVIKVWNAVPSSSFAMLGSVTMGSAIKDVTAFCRRDTEGTFVFILTENESKTGVLSRLLLPKDFGSSFKNYQKDSVGNLSADALDMRDLELGRQFVKVELHSELGALLYSGPGSEIYRVNPWTWIGFENAVLIPLVMPETTHSWCLSLDQDWIATAEEEDSQVQTMATCERIELRNTSQIIKNGCAPYVAIASDWMGESCLNFSLFSKSLICGKKNGEVVNYQWTHKSFRVPEWLVYCFSHFETENSHLRSMDAEEQECASQVEETAADLSQFKGKELNFLEACISVINFKLDSIGVRELVDETDCGSIAYSDHLCELTRYNRENIFLALPQSMPDDVKVSLDDKVDQVKSVSYVNNQITVEDYSRASIERDRTMAKNLDANGSGNEDQSKNNHHSFGDTVMSKYKADSLSAIRKLLGSICDHKIAFNAKFDEVCGKRQKISSDVEQLYLDARSMSQLLPSKTESDFWTSAVENPDVFLEAELDNNDNNSESSSPVAVVKRLIVDKLRSSSVIQQAFNSFVVDLRLMKHFCDFSILGSEMKMYANLLLSTIKDDISNWKKLFESSKESLEANLKESLCKEKEIRSLRGDMKIMFEELLRYELSLSKKLEVKCSDMNFPETLSDEIKDQIELRLDCFIQDHQASQSLSIDPESVPLEMKDLTERFECPSAVPKSAIENVRHLQTRLLTLGILRCNLKSQLLFVADTMQLSYDYCHTVWKIVEEIEQSLKLLSILVSNVYFKFHSLNEILDEVTNTSEDIVKVKGRKFLKTLPTQDHKMWTDIDQKTSRMLSIKQQLKEIEVLYDRIQKLNSDILDKSRCEFELFMDNIKRRFEEARQAFNVTNSIREEYIDKRKSSALKFLKSALRS